jgi:CBS domain-containing protein
MKASDVMVSPVISVKPDMRVQEVAKILVEKHISAVPVIDKDGKIVGMVSEGDLMHRSEAGTERRHSWWLELLTGNDTLATEYIQANAQIVSDVMTHRVISVTPETPLSEIAVLMERNRIKRLPVLRDHELVGIVSRANIVQALASAPAEKEMPASDKAIRDQLIARIKAQPWAHTSQLNVTVKDGVVSFWGVVNSETERKALCVAAEGTPGVKAVNDNMIRHNYGAYV